MTVRLYYIFRDFSRQMTRKISVFARSAAFFLLAVIPLLMSLCAILPYTPLTAENLIHAITQVTPNTMNGFVEQVVGDVYARSAGTITVFAIVAVWSAGKAMLALIRGLNEVNDFEEHRNYLMLRMIAFVYTVIMLVAILISMLIMVFGNVIVNIALHDFPQLHVLVQLIMHFRFLFSWLLLTLDLQ